MKDNLVVISFLLPYFLISICFFPDKKWADAHQPTSCRFLVVLRRFSPFPVDFCDRLSLSVTFCVFRSQAVGFCRILREFVADSRFLRFSSDSVGACRRREKGVAIGRRGADSVPFGRGWSMFAHLGRTGSKKIERSRTESNREERGRRGSISAGEGGRWADVGKACRKRENGVPICRKQGDFGEKGRKKPAGAICSGGPVISADLPQKGGKLTGCKRPRNLRA